MTGPTPLALPSLALPATPTHHVFLLHEAAVRLGVVSKQLLDVTSQVLSRHFSGAHLDALQQSVMNEDILTLHRSIQSYTEGVYRVIYRCSIQSCIIR